MRTILGIDPGTATTGYAVLKIFKKEPTLIEYGCIKTNARLKLPERLLIISKDLKKIISKHKPKEIAVEEIFFAKNAKTAISVGHARGAILLTAREKKLKIFEYTPLQTKQAVTGYGRATKHQMQHMVKSILKLDRIPKPDDAADAIAIALCHLNSTKH